MTRKVVDEALTVAAGHAARLERLHRPFDADPDAAAAREAADALLAGRPAGEPQKDARARADQLLGLPPELAVVAPAAELSWAEVVSLNRAELEATGLRPDSVTPESLLDASTLVRVEAEWAEFSSGLDARLDEAATAALLLSFRRAAIDAIARPLGLGLLVARLDKVGGGVLTPHNAEEARQGRLDASELASPGHARDYAAEQNAAEGPGRSRHHGKLFRDAPRDGTEDAYRDVPLTQADLDHVVPASHIDKRKDVNFFLDPREKDELINSPENHALTDSALNKSKGDSSAEEWMSKRRPDGSTNEAHYQVNREKMEASARRANEHIESVIASKQARYYLAETAKAGAVDAVKVGLQQAIGAVLVELALGLFDEVADLVRHGRKEAGFIAEFTARAKRVGARVLAAWKDVVAAFKAGALAGFLSAVVTAVINAVVSTSKRFVRILREGVLSLLRAVRLMVSPPRGMHSTQAAHEASKLLAAAVAVSVGIAVEEAVEKAVCAAIPALAPVAPFITTCAVGLATGVASVLLVSLLDKVDFFGAVARLRGEEREKAMFARTDAMLDALLVA